MIVLSQVGIPPPKRMCGWSNPKYPDGIKRAGTLAISTFSRKLGMRIINATPCEVNTGPIASNAVWQNSQEGEKKKVGLVIMKSH